MLLNLLSSSFFTDFLLRKNFIIIINCCLQGDQLPQEGMWPYLQPPPQEEAEVSCSDPPPTASPAAVFLISADLYVLKCLRISIFVTFADLYAVVFKVNNKRDFIIMFLMPGRFRK